jgi:hypothetical protein
MNEAFDFGDQFFDAAEGAATDGLLRDDVEPDFHLVEPGRVGWCEVQVVTGACGWTDLITQPDGNKLPARVFKSQDRHQIEEEGYRIILNIGDQASDLAGCCTERVFKLPNPFYTVP